MRILTIGHSSHAWEQFVAILQRNAVQVIAEVRSYPYSNYSPQFDREAMKEALTKIGVKYVDLGKVLGGRPEGTESYDRDGYVSYDKVAASANFAEGIRRIEDGLEKYRVAMLCSEEDPAICHRGLLVGRVLRERGAQVDHIRGDGPHSGRQRSLCQERLGGKSRENYLTLTRCRHGNLYHRFYGHSVTILLLRLRNSSESLGRTA
jgi:uncharacterized protein (DUF488 family)